MEKLTEITDMLSECEYGKKTEDLNPVQLHHVVSKAVMGHIGETWEKSKKAHEKTRRAYYFSAEFLMGRAIGNNLLCTGLYPEAKAMLLEKGFRLSDLEQVQDAALGNGGLGRLAACFLDSAATSKIPLDGYGIRYRFGLFKQKIENGFQKECLDYWGEHGDPWSIRKDEESVVVHLENADVVAVPYDMPIIGYKAQHICTLRLWQAEAKEEFDFSLFNEQKYEKAVSEKNFAEDISRVLYPNDSKTEGKLLRLRQQYFFTSASLQDMIRSYKQTHGSLENFADDVAVTLNDTHPVLAIPELIRLLQAENFAFEDAMETARKIFRYTNHTIMQEALEKWDIRLIAKISVEIADIIRRISKTFDRQLRERGIEKSKLPQLKILQGSVVHMAHLACYLSSYINGVALLHTQILKNDVLSCWDELYPDKIVNVTNGITQRRWLALCNENLSGLITRLLKSEDWITDLSRLEELKKYADDKEVLDAFMKIKLENKKALSAYILKKDGAVFNPSFICDVQIKRLHEYKRQLLNILCILELYFEIKEKKLVNFQPTAFIFAAKSAPGYYRAKAIIKLINEVSRLIAQDEEVSKYISVLFASDYNVSYAEKLVCAADVSEQISTAGTEASGTGNMKLMLNGAVTLGTFDGANIEIVQRAGQENNYIFGLTEKEIAQQKDNYNPKDLFGADKRINRCLNALVDGTLDDCGTGMFAELYSSLLEGASWHRADNYFVLKDFDSCLAAKIKVNEDYKNRYDFAKKCWLNMCSAGYFSSDRAICEYADKIWQVDKVNI